MNWKTSVSLIVAATISQFTAYGTLYPLFSGDYATTSALGKTFSALATSQMIGILLGKIVCMLWMSKIPDEFRLAGFLGSYLFSLIPLIFFGFSPPIAQIVMVGITGFFSSFIWGFTIFYIEGRSITDLIIAFVYIAYIACTGVFKTLGKALLSAGLTESWMPFIAGVIALPIYALSSFWLSTIPKPYETELHSKGVRDVTTTDQQLRFLKKHGVGVLLITFSYCAANMFQSYRTYYALEIWNEIYPNGFKSGIYSETEIISGVVALSMYACIFFIKREKPAFYTVIGLMIFGGLWMLLPTLVYRYHSQYDAVAWIILVGIGNYLAYVPPGAIIYDKLMSVTDSNFTAVYPIYISGTASSICSLIVLIVTPIYFKGSYVYWFELLSYITSGVVMGCMGLYILVFYCTINLSI